MNDEQGRVEEKIEAITMYENRIREALPKSFAEYSKSNIVRSATERNLQLISDAELDVLISIYKLVGTQTLGSEASLVKELEGKVDKKALEGFKKRRELRNLLVHAYSEPDLDRQAFGQANEMGDVEEFKKEAKKAIGK